MRFNAQHKYDTADLNAGFRDTGNRLSPRYIDRRAAEWNDSLWRLAKSFLLRYNETNPDPAQAEEMERMKLRASGQKAAPARKLNGLEVKVKALETEREAVTGDRLRRLSLEKEVTRLRRELMRGRESQFFDAMRLDLELEEQFKKFAEQEKIGRQGHKEICD